MLVQGWPGWATWQIRSTRTGFGFGFGFGPGAGAGAPEINGLSRRMNVVTIRVIEARGWVCIVAGLGAFVVVLWETKQRIDR